MSPQRVSPAPTERVLSAVNRVSVVAGTLVHDERRRRQWTLRHLAGRAGLSVGTVHGIEAGRPASLEAYARLANALGLQLGPPIAEVGRRQPRPSFSADIVHSAMGEFEVLHLRPHGFGIGIDEPYQHYQFAGRADLVAWSVERRALLHIENRTQFPDLQDMAGRFNAKRAYLGRALAERLGVPNWHSETHVIAALWSSEVLHALRLRTETFRALCPNENEALAGWWAGSPPARGRYSTLVVIDPLATGRQRQFVKLEQALTARPRYRGYREAAHRLAHV